MVVLEPSVAFDLDCGGDQGSQQRFVVGHDPDLTVGRAGEHEGRLSRPHGRLR